LSHPLDAAVKTLYSPPPRINLDTAEFIVQSQGHITKRALPVQGRSAFVHAAFGPMEALVGEEDWMHPGEGGA
jgi:hypothetical protein